VLSSPAGILLLAVSASSPAAEPPARLVNARVETRSAAAGLESVVHELKASRGGPLWVGYAVASVGGDMTCCFDSGRTVSRCAGCRLETQRAFTLSDGRDARESVAPPTALEGHREALVLFRLAEGRIGDVRAYSAECALDAAGLPFVWLTDVSSADSLALLAQLVDAAEDEVLAAIAQHADPAADAILINLARGGRSSALRGQALFWLAQKASRKAVGEIERAILEDPETEVKEQAVFALSEMPRGEGVPILIGLARAHKNPAVRERAFFWLGESEDPRALAFFQEVLGR
jgi:hypothetical protein